MARYNINTRLIENINRICIFAYFSVYKLIFFKLTVKC